MLESYDIALTGHIYCDTVMMPQGTIRRLGGIANVWPNLLTVNPRLRVAVEPMIFAEALIVPNGEHNFVRTHVSALRMVGEIDANWVHLAYLNDLPIANHGMDINEGAKFSADLTRGLPPSPSVFDRLDILFYGRDDVEMDFTQVAREIKGWAIMHSPDGSWCSDGKNEFHIKRERVAGIAPIGAGDSFAAYILAHTCKGVEVNEQLVKAAHEYVEADIKSQLANANSR